MSAGVFATALKRLPVLLLVGFALTATAAGKPDLDDIRSRIESLKKDLDSKEDAKADASDALKTSEQAISHINQALRQLGDQQRQASTNLANLEKKKSSLQVRIVEEQTQLGRLLYQQYLSGQQDQFKILLNQEDPSQALRQFRYYSYLARARSDLIERLRKNLPELQNLIQATGEKQAELKDIRDEQDKQKRQLLVQQQEKKRLLAQLAQQIGHQRRELSQLQKDEKRLTQLIERLAKLQQAPKKSASSHAQRNTQLPDASLAGTPFPQLKGKLALPVRGELAGRFGSQRQDSGATWKGLFIRTAAGQEVHSIANGRVVFADWLRGFGNLIIIDHGGGYMSLYGNNEALFKQAGENAKAGEVIASTGNSGGNPETGLYFELRYQSKPFDPLSWCRIG